MLGFKISPDSYFSHSLKTEDETYLDYWLWKQIYSQVGAPRLLNSNVVHFCNDLKKCCRLISKKVVERKRCSLEISRLVAQKKSKLCLSSVSLKVSSNKNVVVCYQHRRWNEDFNPPTPEMPGDPMLSAWLLGKGVLFCQQYTIFQCLM